jgi:hypothetical protein
MEIHIRQKDIEKAIKDYVAKMGLNRGVQSIQFNISRKGGTTVDAEIQMAELGDVAETVEVPVEASKPTPTKTSAPQAEPAKAEAVPDKPAKAAKPEKTPEPAKEEDEPPFEPDQKANAVNDSQAEAPAKESKSLFGNR